MNQFRFALVGSFVLAVLMVGLNADDATTKAKPVCPVSGKDIDKSQTAKHLEATVYFCCPNCAKAFAANTEKFSAKANLQTVQTKQTKQTKCPFSGKPLAEGKTATVAGVDVGFCCGNCLSKANGVEGDKQIQLIFSDAAFKKGFELSKSE